MLRKILCYFLLILTTSTISESSELKLELDRNQSIISGVTNISTLYLGLNDIQDDFDGVRFKIFNSSILSVITTAFGHEYYGHSYLLRKNKIDHNYNIKFIGASTSYKLNYSDLELNVVINGLKFNSELCKEMRKNQVVNQIDYKNSINLIVQKFIPYCTYIDTNSGSDYIDYKKYNPKNDFKEHAKISLFDPTLWCSIYCVSKSFIYNEEIEYDMPALSIDFEIYPHETSNLFTIARMIDDYYVSLSYEKGSKHEGCGFKITNIKFSDIISLDYKFHYFNGFDHSITMNYYNHFYMKLNYENCDYDISNNIQIGWRF